MIDRNRPGFVKMKRSILSWRWFSSPTVCHLYHALIYMADYFDHYDQGILLKPGQVLTTVKELEDITGLTRQQIRTALQKLESTNDITTKSTNKNTLVTIENYTKHQRTMTTSNQKGNQKNNQQSAENNHQGPQNNHQGHRNNHQEALNSHQATNIPIIKEKEEIKEIKETIEISEQDQNETLMPDIPSMDEIADRMAAMREQRDRVSKKWGLL